MACFIYIAKSGGRASEHPFRFDEGVLLLGVVVFFLGADVGGGGFLCLLLGFFGFVF